MKSAARSAFCRSFWHRVFLAFRDLALKAENITEAVLLVAEVPAQYLDNDLVIHKASLINAVVLGLHFSHCQSHKTQLIIGWDSPKSDTREIKGD